MFKLVDSHKVTWPVTIQKPIDGGKVEKHKVDAVFEILPSEESMELSREGELLERVVVGLKTEIGDEEGNPVEFEGEIRKRFLRIPYVRAALVEAYFQAAAGREAQQKN